MWFVPRFAAGLTAHVVACLAVSFVAWFTANLATVGTRPASDLSTTSASAAASAKIAGCARASDATRRLRRSRFRLFLARHASGIGELHFAIEGWTTRFQTVARTRLGHRTIRRDGFIQILVLLFQIHEIGDVKEGVAFQPNVDEGGLHAWQHACYSALINRAC